MQDYAAFAIAGIVLIVSPGPATLSMAATGAAFGFRRGFVFLSGCASGLMLVCLMAAFGLNAAVDQLPWLKTSLGLIGFFYILYLAWRIATADVHTNRDSRKKMENKPPPGYISGIILSLTNPKAYAVTAALFSTFPAFISSAFWDIFFKLLILGIITFAGNIAWTRFGDLFSRTVKDPLMVKRMNYVFAIALVASVVFAFVIN